MISVFVHVDGETKCVDRVEPGWLDPTSGATLWVDMAQPTPEEGRILSDLFKFHPLAVEDALSAIQFPKIESYQNYLYLILHGINFRVVEHHFATHDTDFFVGSNYLVTVHDGASRSIAKLRDTCNRHGHVLREGPVGLLHRIVDTMVDNYGPEVDALEERITVLEERAFLAQENLIRELLALKRDLTSLRRVLLPQRDAIGRLARREFPAISDEMSYRFRDVHDHVVRMVDESGMFQDRVTGIIDAHLSTLSNRLNQVMKVLTVMSTIFLPLTVITGMWGMNIQLPAFPGGEASQFWWVSGAMAVIIIVMLVFFRRKGWI